MSYRLQKEGRLIPALYALCTCVVVLVVLSALGVEPAIVILAWIGTVLGMIFGEATTAIINFLGLPDMVAFGADVGPAILEGIATATDWVVAAIVGPILIAILALKRAGRI